MAWRKDQGLDWSPSRLVEAGDHGRSILGVDFKQCFSGVLNSRNTAAGVGVILILELYAQTSQRKYGFVLPLICDPRIGAEEVTVLVLVPARRSLVGRLARNIIKCFPP